MNTVTYTPTVLEDAISVILERGEQLRLSSFVAEELHEEPPVREEVVATRIEGDIPYSSSVLRT